MLRSVPNWMSKWRNLYKTDLFGPTGKVVVLGLTSSDPRHSNSDKKNYQRQGPLLTGDLGQKYESLWSYNVNFGAELMLILSKLQSVCSKTEAILVIHF